jgi:DNA primase
MQQKNNRRTNYRFSPELLRLLRNQVNINILITNVLQMPYKTSENQLRFLCPVCSEFNTATNHKTNLARCFRCGKNFNPIDMVMTVQNCSFINAVGFLKQLRDEKGCQVNNLRKDNDR